MECLLSARFGTRIGSNSLSSRLVPHKDGLNSIQSPTGLHKRPHLYTTCAFRQGGPDYVEDKNSQTMKSGLQSIEGPKWNSDALFEDAVEPFWEQLSLTFRVIYALGLYAGLAFAGQAICKFMGTDYWGGFDLNPETILQGLGYSVVPMMVLLLLQDDEIVKAWPPARAVRDVEDGELMEYFEGMGWQFVPIVMAGALSEELFFRVAVQGGLTHAVQASASLNDTQTGLSALTAVVPSFAPFAQVIGVVLTSALTGSTYYLITAPKDPTYVIAPVTRGRKAFKDMKKRFEAWNERRQQRKIYSPLMESLLALYLGVEWLQTGNILAPMITHLVYSNVVIGHGLLRLHYQRVKLRQRVANILGKKSSLAG